MVLKIRNSRKSIKLLKFSNLLYKSFKFNIKNGKLKKKSRGDRDRVKSCGDGVGMRRKFFGSCRVWRKTMWMPGGYGLKL